jgi:5-methylcytosine-specific restriction endonuclease McrA
MIPRYVPLTRRKPLRERPASELGRPDRLTREAVHERDEGLCVVCGRGGLIHLHHRRPVRAGGSRAPEVHAAANLVSVCAGCHRRIHARPAWARDAGLLLPAGADPEAVPVRVHGRGLVLLSNDGGIADTDAVVRA